MRRLLIVFCVLCFHTTFLSCQMRDMPVVGKAREQLQQQEQNNEEKQQQQNNEDPIAAMRQAVEIYEKIKGIDLDQFRAELKDAAVKQTCLDDYTILVEAIKKYDLRALTMLDAAGKPPTGILQGLFNWMGSYNECLNVTFQTSNTSQFTGRYCNMQVGSPSKSDPGALPKSVTVGVCIPSSCSVYEVEFYINLALKNASVSEAIRTFGGWCQPLHSEIPPMSAGAKAMIVILSILGFFLVLGTGYDILIYQRREAKAKELEAMQNQDIIANGSHDPVDLPAEVNVVDYTPLMNGGMPDAEPPQSNTAVAVEVGCSILLAFSVVRNMSKLFHVPPPGDNNLAVIHGVRFISMTWVILGHTFAFIIQFIANPVFGQTLINRMSFQAILNATVSVDTFFLLSGTLVTYLTLKEMEKRDTWNLKWGWLMFYVHRYWRLTAPYMLVLGFWTTLYQYTGSGPNWPPGDYMAGFCNETWWTNMLYVNNLVKTDKMCMAWSWYLANDMQFYIISPLFIVLLYVWFPVGAALTGAGILVCLITNGVLSVKDKLGIGILSFGADPNFFANIYIAPWLRIGPYLVGVLLGYALWKTKLNCKIPKALAALGWFVAIASAEAIIYGPYTQVHGPKASLQLAGFYNSVNRTVWAACVAWVIFACINGQGGIINRILSWPALVPLSRLTYMAYLVHPAVIYNFYMTRPALFYVDDFQLIYLFLGNLVMSYMVALVVSVALESPLMGIERALRRKDKKQ